MSKLVTVSVTCFHASAEYCNSVNNMHRRRLLTCLISTGDGITTDSSGRH